jgi:hypothetical protein
MELDHSIRTDPPRSIALLHGAAVVLVGLLCGLVAVVEEIARSQPQLWRSAHNALLLAGAWILATAAVMPSLALGQRERAALSWSLVATAYAFTTTLLVQAITGVRVLEPRGPVTQWIAFLGTIVTVGASLLAALLTLQGTWAALRGNRGRDRRIEQ